MTEKGKEASATEERLIMRGWLSELAQVPPWIDRMASQYAIPSNVRYAIDLCLEEALSNIVLHGYSDKAAYYLIVRFTVPRDGYFVFVVEDEAPHFNPLEQAELPAPNPGDGMWIDGLGIRLLKQFADLVEYEPLRTGNRLRMTFSATGLAAVNPSK